MGRKPTAKLTDLPIELIERVFDHLSLYQRTILLQVCRVLSHPCYWQHTYRAVSLYDMHQLQSFVNTIELSPNGFSKLFLGECVRHLTLWKNLLDSGADTVEFLQRQCPNAECVELTGAATNTGPDIKTLLPCKIPSNCWHGLKVIYSSLLDDWDDDIREYEQQVQHLIMYKPIDFGLQFSFSHLIHLDYRAPLLIHSLEELDKINRACPMLQCLHLGDLDVSWDYDDMIKTMDPPRSLPSLTALALDEVYFSDPAMYQIFGVFYPNLISLKIQHMRAKAISGVEQLNGTWVEVDTDDDIDVGGGGDNEYDNIRNAQRSHARQQLRQQQLQLQQQQRHHTWPLIIQSLDLLLTNLPCVRQLHLPSIGVSPCTEEWSPGNPWLQHCTRLDDLRLDWYCKSFKAYNGVTDKRPEPKWERVLHLLDLCQDTVQAWHLFLKHDPISIQRTVFEKLAQCSWLHSLTIHTTYESDTTLSIDELLTSLPHIKSLEIQTKFGKDLLSPIEKTAPRLRSVDVSAITPHCLTRFVYIGKLYSSRLVAYINARCPGLSVLHLDARQTPSKKTITLQLAGRCLQELDIGSTFTVGKMMKTVLVQEMSYSPPRSRWFQFSRGSWYRQRQATKSSSRSSPAATANLTIICDYVERCTFKPQDPCFNHAP